MLGGDVASPEVELRISRTGRSRSERMTIVVANHRAMARTKRQHQSMRRRLLSSRINLDSK